MAESKLSQLTNVIKMPLKMILDVSFFKRKLDINYP